MWQWLIKKIFKRCFAQGNNNERYILLKAMLEAVENEYTEENYNTRISWLVEEILRSDRNFCRSVGCLRDKDMLANALHNSVENVWLKK